MGSMASGIEDLHDSGSKVHDHLETLDEDDDFRQPNEDLLKTPKPSKEALKAPTDTVIARHVRNVQVPESLAEEYKYKSGLATPRKPSDMTAVGTVGTARSGKNLTLKEQSSTIERLSKENFDLKLKVMFLSDRLDKLSEEGVKEMISENVDLKTSLAVVQRDNKALRRRVKELEKQLKDEDERPGTARSGASSNGQTSHSYEDAEREEELLYLRERVEEYMVEIEKLKHDCINKEAEKRRLSEVVRSLGERNAGESLGRQEEADVWKDLLEQETARREQADEDNRRLRDEVFRLKQEMTAVTGGLHHTTNIYNITKKPKVGSPSRPMSVVSGADADAQNNGTLSTSSTLVEELRRESDQLRHENAELRREVGAQTSMLTSRNREKERLYQEIEDLKMAQRRGGPAPSVVDSILERSASRAGAHHQRSHSRASGTTRITAPAPEDPEREELENQLAEMRDKMNEIKLQNQELQRELDTCMEDFETAVETKRQAEELAMGLQEDVETAMNDLVALQAERDDALREQADMENEFEALRKEAQDEINALESEADQRNEEMQRLQLEVNDRTENFDALQEEMRKMSDALLRLEDEQDNKLRRIEQLEQELADANKELEELDAKLAEANEKASRLGIQQESSQGEIAFLREEQEADKIRIGDLEAALANVEQSVRDEKDRVRELDQRLATERRQREMVANREKEEVQQFVNELNREASAAKDESRKLRKALTSREVEAAEWKERLMELENNLREALGDLNGTRSSLLKVSDVLTAIPGPALTNYAVHCWAPAAARRHRARAQSHQGVARRKGPHHQATRLTPRVTRPRVPQARRAPREGAAGPPQHQEPARNLRKDAPAHGAHRQHARRAHLRARICQGAGPKEALDPGEQRQGPADGAQQSAVVALDASEHSVRQRLGARQQPHQRTCTSVTRIGDHDAPGLPKEPPCRRQDHRGHGGRVSVAHQGRREGLVAGVSQSRIQP